jgi:uncharacterized membrane protein
MAFLALFLGIAQLTLKKGTQLHRMTGYLWVALIAVVAISSFWIHDLRIIGPFSPIHLLSIWALYNLIQAIRAARAGDITSHAQSMRSLYFYALIGAGAFTLLPGRVMHAVVFGQ